MHSYIITNRCNIFTIKKAHKFIAIYDTITIIIDSFDFISDIPSGVDHISIYDKIDENDKKGLATYERERERERHGGDRKKNRRIGCENKTRQEGVLKN